MELFLNLSVVQAILLIKENLQFVLICSLTLFFIVLIIRMYLFFKRDSHMASYSSRCYKDR